MSQGTLQIILKNYQKLHL